MQEEKQTYAQMAADIEAALAPLGMRLVALEDSLRETVIIKAMKPEAVSAEAVFNEVCRASGFPRYPAANPRGSKNDAPL
jgi:hypothetical protein